MTHLMPSAQPTATLSAPLSTFFGLVAFAPFAAVLGPFVGLFFSFSSPLARAIDDLESSFPTALLAAIALIGLAAAIAAIITGRNGMKAQPRLRGLIRGLAATGLILGSVSLVLDLLGLILLGFIAHSFG